MRSAPRPIAASWLTTIIVIPRRSRASCEQIEDALGVLRVERPGRLVGEQQPRVVGEGARDSHPLALAAGEVHGERVDAVAQADRVEQGGGAPLTLGPGRPAPISGISTFALAGRWREQLVVLEDEADHLAVEAVVPPLADADVIDLHRARVRTVEVADHREQRGLARAGRTGEDHELAGLERDRDPVEGDDRAGVHAADLVDDHPRPARRGGSFSGRH